MEKLIAAQEHLHGRITRSCENLRKTGRANITPDVLEAALNLLDGKWAKFEAQHERLLAEYGSAQDPYVTADVEAQVENDYLLQRGKLKELGLALFGAPVDVGMRAERHERGDGAPHFTHRHSLPRI